MTDFQKTIDRYYELNAKALEDLPPFVVREFSPLTFQRFNYSTEVRQKSDLWKFADCQHENRFNENIDLLGGAISQREFDWIKEISVKVLELTADMNHPVVVKNSITRAVLHLRAILGAAALKGKKIEDLSVMEIGPGSGYLGLLCRKNKIKYWGCDVTQSLSLYQNYIWNELEPNSLRDGNNSNIQVDDQFVQLPWWLMTDRNFSLPCFDVVVINHAVNEISPMGFMFEIERLQNTFKNGLLLVEGWGGGSFHHNCFYLDELGATTLHQSHSTSSKYLAVSILQIPSTHSKCSEDRVMEIKQSILYNLKELIKTIISGTNSYFIFRSIKNQLKEILKNKLLEKFYLNEIITKNSIFFIKKKESIPKSELLKFYDQLASNGVSFYSEDELFCNFIKSKAHHLT